MEQVLIRNIEPRVLELLKKQAKENDRSLEAELRVILRREAGLDREEFVQKLKEIHASYKGKVFSDSTALIREMRDSR